MGSAAPLMTLRDLLELKCESSCSDGFRSYPRRLPRHVDDGKALQAKEAPVQLLIESDLRRSPSRTLSSILFPRSPGSLATVSRLTRSLSRRLVFWRRHRGDDDEYGWSVGDERDSLGLPSPVVSSCSASQCSESVAEVADPLVQPEELQSGASDESEKPSPSTSSACTGSANDDASDGVAAGDGHTALEDGDPVGSGSLESMVDKQQLSPVSVMDFPFHDEDDGDERSDAGTCSPSFLQRQHDLERTSSSSAHEPLPLPLHKIRRLDGLAQAAVDPVDLEPRFIASDDSRPSSVSGDTQAQSDSSSASTDHDRSSATTSTTTLSTDEQHHRGADDEEGDPDHARSSETTSTTLSSTDHDSASATTSTTLSSDDQHRSADDGEREPDEHLHYRLLEGLLKDDDGTVATSDAAAERLLLDFLAEGLGRLRELKVGQVVGTVRPSSDHDEWALVRAAKEWLLGAGTRWGVEDVLFAGPAALADMDRERRWMCVGEEEREVSVAVGELLMDALVAELVSDLAARC
ncbi:uncharacterized protein [Lolium perenne]|uniref:uncharacterized protein n=1 Tax=Lolium perenne TaxID=4522 RepID=UPI0021F56F2F|nr:uncharacterized protein LOC127297359 [Lolium perenne]